MARLRGIEAAAQPTRATLPFGHHRTRVRNPERVWVGTDRQAPDERQRCPHSCRIDSDGVQGAVCGCKDSAVNLQCITLLETGSK